MRLHESAEENKRIRIVALSIFCLYFYLAYNTPLTHDDWTWGSSLGLRRLYGWFENYNGRYMGNIVEIFLTRFHLIRFAVMALFSTALVVLAAQNKKSRFNLLLSLLLFLYVPITMFSQTYAWVAGFSNYITSIVLVLIYLTIVGNIFGEQTPKYASWLIFAVIPLGVATQLFVEHITIYTVVMAAFVIIFAYVKFRKLYTLHVAYFLSTIAGAIIMFSNGAYAYIFRGEDSYRAVETAQGGLISRAISSYIDQIYPLLFSNNTMLNIIISIFCLILMTRSGILLKRFPKLINNTLFVVFIIFPLYKPIVADHLGIHVLGEYTKIFEAFLTLIYYFAVLVTIVIFTNNINFKQRMLFYLLSAVFLAAPLLIVQPIGPRNFIASYTFFAMVAVGLGTYILDNKYIKLKLFNQVFLILITFISICHIHALSSNGSVDRERIDYVQDQVKSGEKSILLTRLPYEHYLWASTPNPRGNHMKFFKEYYDIPGEIELKIITYEEWKKIKSE